MCLSVCQKYCLCSQVQINFLRPEYLPSLGSAFETAKNSLEILNRSVCVCVCVCLSLFVYLFVYIIVRKSQKITNIERMNEEGMLSLCCK